MTIEGASGSKYLKRFRLEIDLRDAALPRPELPPNYHWAAWHPTLIEDHASVKYESFREEMDCKIFPALRSLNGCRELMRSISTHIKFLPQATWLIQFSSSADAPLLPCGTIQGLTQSSIVGSIQNVGVLPQHRGLGLGRALLLKNLHGFRSTGLLRVYLDVSAENLGAMALYRSLGFQYLQTSFREILTSPTASN